jgi:hypothetical protein
MAKFIKIRVQTLLDAGTDATGTEDKLTVASTAAFKEGDIVHNTSDNTFATITAIDSATVASLSADIMDDDETYSVYSATEYVEKPILAEGIALVKRGSNKYQSTINYTAGGTNTDVITVLHQPVASAYDTSVEQAIDNAILDAHSNGNRPDIAKLVTMPDKITALAVTID